MFFSEKKVKAKPLFKKDFTKILQQTKMILKMNTCEYFEAENLMNFSPWHFYIAIVNLHNLLFIFFPFSAFNMPCLSVEIL